MAMNRGAGGHGIQEQQRSACFDHASVDAAAANVRGALLPKSLRAFLEFDPEPRLPFGWEKCFDVQTGLVFFKNSSTGIRTSKDPRGHHQQQQEQDGADSGPLPCLAPDQQQGYKPQGLTPRMERNDYLLGGATMASMQEKLSSWKSSSSIASSKKLPPLLSLKSTDTLLSLELSLRLEGPQARESSSASPLTATTAGDHQQQQARGEQTSKVKVERVEEKCVQNFLGPNHHMGPFPSAFLKVKEEPTSPSLRWSQASPVVCTGELSVFPDSTTSERRELLEVPGTIHLDQLKLRDFLGMNYNMGPFTSVAGPVKEEPRQEPMPSSLEQSAVSCTLEKVQTALKRSHFDCKTAFNSAPAALNATQPNNSSAAAALPWCAKSNLLPYPVALPSPMTKLSSRSLSPTTSDASSAASSKSSRHSSTSPSVMSFQGEELDDLGAHASSSDASPSSQVLHCSNPKGAHGEAPGVLVAVGCTTCHMFLMLSKDDPSCPKCGSTGLLEILPTSSSSPRKRQRMESSNEKSESRRRWDADDC